MKLPVGTPEVARRASSPRLASAGFRGLGGGVRLSLVLTGLLLIPGCQRGGRHAVWFPQTTQPAAAAAATARYFFVVPQVYPSGRPTTAQQKELEAWLVREVGGYTRLGPCHGGWSDGQNLIEEDNIAYFIVGPDGLKSRIERFIVERFDQRRGFVVQW